MTIEEAIALCDQQIDGKNDEYANIWRDVKATLEAVPTDAIKRLVEYNESEKEALLDHGERKEGTHIGNAVIEVEEWLKC